MISCIAAVLILTPKTGFNELDTVANLAYTIAKLDGTELKVDSKVSNLPVWVRTDGSPSRARELLALASRCNVLKTETGYRLKFDSEHERAMKTGFDESAFSNILGLSKDLGRLDGSRTSKEWADEIWNQYLKSGNLRRQSQTHRLLSEFVLATDVKVVTRQRPLETVIYSNKPTSAEKRINNQQEQALSRYLSVNQLLYNRAVARETSAQDISSLRLFDPTNTIGRVVFAIGHFEGTVTGSIRIYNSMGTVLSAYGRGLPSARLPIAAVVDPALNFETRFIAQKVISDTYESAIKEGLPPPDPAQIAVKPVLQAFAGEREIACAIPDAVTEFCLKNSGSVSTRQMIERLQILGFELRLSDGVMSLTYNRYWTPIELSSVLRKPLLKALSSILSGGSFLRELSVCHANSGEEIRNSRLDDWVFNELIPSLRENTPQVWARHFLLAILGTLSQENYDAVLRGVPFDLSLRDAKKFLDPWMFSDPAALKPMSQTHWRDELEAGTYTFPLGSPDRAILRMQTNCNYAIRTANATGPITKLQDLALMIPLLDGVGEQDSIEKFLSQNSRYGLVPPHQLYRSPVGQFDIELNGIALLTDGQETGIQDPMGSYASFSEWPKAARDVLLSELRSKGRVP